MSLTHEQRVELIESDRVDVELRVEVLDQNDQVLGEIDVDTCVIRHDALGLVHRSVELVTTAVLEWQRQRIRPWVWVTNGFLAEEVPMGVFVLTHPAPDSERPPTYSVTGYDKLYLTDQKLVEPVTHPSGQPILHAVQQVLDTYGPMDHRLDTARASDELPEPKVWPVEFDGTALEVVNELLGMVGYQSLFVDERGFAKSGPVVPIDQRPVAWRYDAQDKMTIVDDAGRSLEEDFTDAPNYWVFWSANTVRDDPPVVNDGLYIVRNEHKGPASISARGDVLVRSDNDGPIEAATQDDLVANGNAIVAEEMYAVTTYKFTTDVNPFHVHEHDVLEVIDRDFGVAGRFRHTSWELDVLERRMDHVANKIVGGIT